MIKWFLLALTGIALGGVLHVRLSASAPEDWHVNPDTAVMTGKPNAYRVIDRQFDAPPDTVAMALNTVALSEKGTSVLGGSMDEAFVTYVQRSGLLGFPDYISVKIADAEGGGTYLSLYSRSRYGYHDMGVNQARVGRWLDDVQERIQFPAGQEKFKRSIN